MYLQADDVKPGVKYHFVLEDFAGFATVTAIEGDVFRVQLDPGFITYTPFRDGTFTRAQVEDYTVRVESITG